MAQITQLQAHALPGQVRTFLPKAAASARVTVSTIFAALIGTVPTKYRVMVRQRQGGKTIKTVAGISQLRVTLHPRTNLLANDTTIIASDDTYLDQGGPTINRTTLGFMNFMHIQPSSESKPMMAFDVSALAGFVWKTAVLKLTFDVSGGGTPPFSPTLYRIKRSVVWLSGATDPPSWNIYDTAQNWQVSGAGGVNDRDNATAVSWTTYPSSPYTAGQQIISPDLTALINDANTLNGGTLVLNMAGPTPPFTLQRFTSISGGGGLVRPHLFIEAF